MSDGQSRWPAGPSVSGPRQWPAGVAPAQPEKPVRWWIWWTVGAVLLVLLAVAAWGGVKVWGAFQSSGKTQIVQLHQQMKAQDWAAILADADPAFQEQVGKAKSDRLFSTVREHMGDPVSYSVDSVHVSTNSTDGTTEDLVLETKFTKGDGVETLRYHKVGGVWRMTAYRCNSKLLDGVHLEDETKADAEEGK